MALKGFSERLESSSGNKGTAEASPVDRTDAGRTVWGMAATEAENNLDDNRHRGLVRPSLRDRAPIPTMLPSKVAFAHQIMPGERRNGHCLSCVCKDCRKLVEEDADRWLRGLIQKVSSTEG